MTKKLELLILLNGTDPAITGKAESWANAIISDAELRIKHTMVQKDRVGEI